MSRKGKSIGVNMAENKKHKNTTGRKIWHAVKTGLKIFILIMLVAIIILGLLFYRKYGKNLFELQSQAKELVSSSTIDTFRQDETSLIYDSKGKLISTLKGTKDVYYLSYEDIPNYAKNAMISIEDKKFLKHNGVDMKAIIRAGIALVKNKGDIKQGASTITQQLSRAVFLTNEKSWERKIKEMFIATELEKKYTKYQIMEFYLNNIYFSNGYYGIQAASKGYFSKNVNELTLAEIAYICAIPNSPTYFNPLEYPDSTKKRQNRILDQMYEDEKITKQEYNEAKNQEIVLNIKEQKRNNYVETYARYCAIKALMKTKGFVFEEEFNTKEEEEEYDERYEEMYNQCQKALFNSGYRIYTSIDLQLQKKLQSAVNTTLKEYTEKDKDGTYLLQGAGVCIDNESGRVVAIVGGRNQNAKGYTLNRGYQSFRQPGSSIKPLLVYTPAFEQGYDPSQIVDDRKAEDGPSNSNGVYSGKITLRKAIEQSKNTIADQIFKAITPQVGLSYLKKMNFSKLDKRDYVPAAALGGFTNGASPVEMASGYAALENDGIFREPTCIVKIMDAQGQEIVSDHLNPIPVYDENAARMMTDVLTGVLKYGTGRGLELSNMSSAGKTGTTNEKKDGWFVGYTPYYTTSVWVGFDTPKSLEGLMGNTYPGKIWYTFMSDIHEGLENKSFSPYVSNVVPEEVKPKEEEVVKEEPEEEIVEEPVDPPEEDIPEEDVPEEDTGKNDSENGSDNENNDMDNPDTGEGETGEEIVPPEDNGDVENPGDSDIEGEVPDIEGEEPPLEGDIIEP